MPVTVTALYVLPTGGFGANKTGGLLTPTGVVTLYDGAALVTGGVLVDGLATLNLPLPAGGVHTLTVLYSGDDRYVHDQAATLLVVNRGATSSTLSGPPAPTVYGQPVTLTATVAALSLQARGGDQQPALPSGQVQLYEGQSVLASGDLSAGAAYFTLPVLSSGVHTFTAVYLGDGNYLTSTAATAHTVQPLPTAVNDAAGVLEGAAVDVTVLANDHDPAGGGLTVVAVTQPAQGAASVNPGGQSVHYAAAASGMVSFTYTLQDANGQQSTALVAVVVTARAETDAPPQIAPVDPAVQSTQHFTSSQATVTVELPAGFFTGTVGPTQLFFLSYTPIVTPTAPTQTPPGALQFAHFEFELTAFLDAQPLHGVVFAQPSVLTIRYIPALLAGIDPATLGLFTWNGSAWTTDGIARVSHDIAGGVLTVALSHLSDFALFGAASPTDLEPEPEPGAMPLNLYLPSVIR